MSTTWNDERNWGDPIDMAEFGRDLVRRRAAYEAKNGPLIVPRNSGNNRTESKRALLAAIDEAAAKRGVRW